MSRVNFDFNNINDLEGEFFNEDFCNSYYGKQKIKKQTGVKSEKEREKGRKINKRRKVAKSA